MAKVRSGGFGPQCLTLRSRLLPSVAGRAARGAPLTFNVRLVFVRLINVARGMYSQLLARPRWLRWLEAAPPSVRKADARFRHSYLSQLFIALLCAIALGAIKQHGGAVPILATLWLAFLGIAALVWPVSAFQLALVAHRSASIECAISKQLHWFSFGLFAYAVVSAFALIALTSIMLFVTYRYVA